MIEETVIFLHGYATCGGLKGRKARFFHDEFSLYSHIDFCSIDFNPTAKYFQYHTITGMIDRLRQFIIERHLENVTLIAISQGANVAVNYAHRYGSVKQLFLLAPELFYDAYSTSEELGKWEASVDEPTFHYGFQETLLLNYGHHQDGLRYVNPPPVPVNTIIIHGINDGSIPIKCSRDYATQYPAQVKLIEVESNHFLDDQYEMIWEQTKKLFDL